MAKAQVFNYTITETYPLSELEKYKDHRRLRVFYEKGCTCVNCGLKGTILAKGIKNKEVHIDLYTDDFYPLTVDHIIPVSLGGSDDMDNLQPMCAGCNFTKGNTKQQGKQPKTKKKKLLPLSFYKVAETLTIRTYYIAKGKYAKKLGCPDEICINPYTGKIAARYGKSYYGKLYIKKR